MSTSAEFNGERLKSARIYRGITISDLAEKTQVTKQAIHQFETNKGKPSLETLLNLVGALGFPREYFYEKDDEVVHVGNTYFRALLTTNKKDRSSQVEKMKLLAKVYRLLHEYVVFPELNLPRLDVEGNELNIEQMALQLREYWGLGIEPIPNMVHLLEKNGFVVTSFDTDSGNIDAFSQRQEINGDEYFFIVLANDKQSAVRRQFDAAHELGHIVLHDWFLDLDQVTREEFRQIETEAHQFAAALLLPRDAFTKDMVYPNKLDYYVELKKKWKVSVSAMIVRARQLELINYNQYQYLMRQMSTRGWRTREPLDDVIKVAQPSLLSRACELLIEKNVLTGEQIIAELSRRQLTLHRHEIEALLGLRNGALKDKTSGTQVVSIRKSNEDGNS